MLVLRLWRSQPGDFFCISTKSASREWKDNFFSRKELNNVTQFIEDNRDKDIYFCPHGFSRRRRKEQYAVMPTLLWADLDEADPRKIPLKPTIAIESSPGRYVGLWVTDKNLPDKNINRRLTYFVGADRGGWDLTQVLRVPGTTNYKYKSTPRVRALWTDGPEYTLSAIKKKLPEEEERDEETSEQALETYKKYEKSFAPWIRRELLKGKPTLGKRSEMMWKLVNGLVESGVSMDDCFTLLKFSPWNKFEGRDDQLRREIEKCGSKKFKGKKIDEESDYKFLQISLAEVEEEEIDWVWRPYLARKEITILEGDPGLGKSYLAEMIAGSIIDGRRLPTLLKGEARTEGKVAYFDLENNAASVTKKRLRLNGFDNLKHFFQEEQPFSIDDEDALENVYKALERLRPTLVVFDTINTYIGSADIYKGSEVQQAMAQFKLIAQRFNCSVLVLRHLTKGTKEKAIYRGAGSINFTGIVRVVMTVGTMPDDPDVRVMAVTKLNIGKKPKAITFEVIGLPDTLAEKDRSKFRWGEWVDLSSEDIIAAPAAKKPDRDDGKEFLQEALSKGPVDVEKLKQTAEGRSIGWRTIQRSADELGIKKQQKGFGKAKTSMWSLPSKGD